MKFTALVAAAICAFSVTASPVPAPASFEVQKRDWLMVTVFDHGGPDSDVQDLYFGSEPCLILNDRWKNKISILEVRGGYQCQLFTQPSCVAETYRYIDAGHWDLAVVKDPNGNGVDNQVQAIKCYGIY